MPSKERREHDIFDLLDRLDSLKEADLQWMADAIIHMSLTSGSQVGLNVVLRAIPMWILRFMLGEAWYDDNVLPKIIDPTSDTPEGRRFLDSDELSFVNEHRVLELAECLYNFQGVEGFGHRKKIMRDSDLESAYAEMECAKILSHQTLGLKFVEPIGKKGSDYEAEIISPAGRVIPCEIKAKKETTAPSQSSLWNTLEHARRQLPKRSPGMIFVRLPTAWTQYFASKAITSGAIDKVFRQSNRLVAVVIVWQGIVGFGAQVAVSNRYLPFFNKRSSQFGDDIEQVFHVTGTLKNEKWARLHNMIASYLTDLR